MSAGERRLIFRYTIWALLAWSLIVFGSLYWSYHHEHSSTLTLARGEAESNVNKDLSFRLWATGHGGVYVPITPETPPNPYLTVPNRDVETTGGRQLTLMNPAYMVRQMQTQYSSSYGVRGHITSLKPLNPGNAPDAWERQTLESFDRGVREAATVADIDGRPHIRVMKAMVAEAGCLKCHGHQGYQVGDIRGGISASVPLEPYLARERQVLAALAWTHTGIWAVGLVMVAGFGRRALGRLGERERAEREIRELNDSLDRRVRERTAALEALNRDLESFSYSVSHDLRAPLRAINGYASILDDEEREHLSAKGRQMLDRVERSAERMGELIDHILEFSRIGRHEMRHEDVDMTTLVRAVADELAAEYPAAGLEIAELPHVRGDAAMLRQVWANLIGNALKFSARRERPQVAIGVEPAEDGPVFFIRDNGAGFDMAFAGRLFGVFQRMHPQGEFPGTGAGLAIVKRIVERHGGRIWAEAEVDKGATFRFTLGG